MVAKLRTTLIALSQNCSTQARIFLLFKAEHSSTESPAAHPQNHTFIWMKSVNFSIAVIIHLKVENERKSPCYPQICLIVKQNRNGLIPLFNKSCVHAPSRSLALSFKETYNWVKKAFNRFLVRTNTRRPVYILTKATDKGFSLPPSSSLYTFLWLHKLILVLHGNT